MPHADHGLTAAEILALSDKELNQVCVAEQLAQAASPQLFVDLQRHAGPQPS